MNFIYNLVVSANRESKDKRNLKNLQFYSVSLGAMLEYWNIERGLLLARVISDTYNYTNKKHN